jgi:nucleoside-diphosphate-sugar epimerase
VQEIRGEHEALGECAAQLRRVAPTVVIDMVAYRERDGVDLLAAFRGVAERVVVASSMDVYRGYGRARRLEPGEPDKGVSAEDAPLRVSRYPYRAQAKGPDDMLYDYEKILVEQAVTSCPELPATVARLPAVYGPGDPYHRMFEYIKRMDDRRSAILMSEHKARWRWGRGYVEDVGAAVALAATDERATGRTYNVGEAQARTEGEWVRTIGKAAGWVGQVLAVPDDLLPGHLRSPNDWRHDVVGDTTRIRHELGYQQAVSAPEAIRRTIAWERANLPKQVDPEQFNYSAEDAALARLEGR